MRVWQFARQAGFLSWIRNSQSGEEMLLLPKGHPHCYEQVREWQMSGRIQEQKVVLYQKEPVDIAYYMVKHATSTITYISRNSFETVRALPQATSFFTSSGPISQSLSIAQFLSNHDLTITNSYLDNHPEEAYVKLCRYLQIPKKQQPHPLMKAVCDTHYVSYSLQPIPQARRIQFLPYLRELRNKYLQTERSLKLKVLERKRTATAEEQKKGMEFWVETLGVERVVRENVEEREEKMNICMELGMCETVRLSDVVEGLGERSHYGVWK